MKRIALLTVLLLVVGLTATFAIDVKPTFALTGTASVTWGFDLDTQGTGFKNTADASYTLSLLAADGTDTHAGTGAAYGSITISNIEFYWTDGALTAGPADTDISAKIVVTPFEIGVYPVPTLGADLLGSLEDADVVDRVIENSEAAFTMPGDGFAIPYGTYLQATFGPATVKVEVVSDDYWTLNTANDYAFGADVTLLFKPFTLAGGYWMGATNTSFSVKATLDNAPFVVWAGFEGVIPTSGTLAYGAGAGATFTIVTDTTLAASVWYGDQFHGLDLQVVFTEPEKGLIPMLDASLKFNLLDVGGTLASEWEIVAAAGYKIGLNSDATNYVRPYVNFTYGNNANTGVVDITPVETVMYAEVGAQLQIIPLTLFTVKWVSGAATGADLASATVSLGSVQFVATVTY